MGRPSPPSRARPARAMPYPRRTTPNYRLELFRRLQCANTDDEYWELFAQLRRALGCRPWEFGIIHPDEPCTHPHAMDRWRWSSTNN
jgi:hypothetical protein